MPLRISGKSHQHRSRRFSPETRKPPVGAGGSQITGAFRAHRRSWGHAQFLPHLDVRPQVIFARMVQDVAARHAPSTGVDGMTALTFEHAIATAPRAQLGDVERSMWGAFASGAISENDAQRLSEALEARKRSCAISSQPKAPKPATARLRPVQRQAAIERRRRQAASGAIPPAIASHFTTGEQAALAVIARASQQQRGRTLMWFLDKIAAIAGVCRSTARNAIRKAKALGLIHVQEQRLRWFRNGANKIRLIASGWMQWLRRGWGQKSDTHEYEDKKEAIGRKIFVHPGVPNRRGWALATVEAGQNSPVTRS